MKYFLFLIIIFRFYELVKTDKFIKLYIEAYAISNQNLQFDIAGLYPASNYMFKVNNRSNRAKCEICSKLSSVKLSVFIVHFEQVNAGWDSFNTGYQDEISHGKRNRRHVFES